MSMSRTVVAILPLVVACLLGRAVAAAAPPDHAAPKATPFFAFCYDQFDSRKRTFDQQAELIKSLGFDGAGHVGLDDLDSRIKSLQHVGLELYLAGTSINPLHPPTSYLPQFKLALPLLKGHPTVIYLILDGLPPNDKAAVGALRRIADEAAKYKVRVAIYPHTGNWVCRVDHAVRLARLVDRPNLGVIFNLCHWLKNEDPSSLDATLRAALPYLFVVTVNGADPAGKTDRDWHRLIQPLDRGSYDVSAVVTKLKKLGYRGPIGLMCWSIPGDAKEHLERSMRQWRKIR